MGCKEKKEIKHQHTQQISCMLKKKERKQSKKMSADVIRSKANGSKSY